MFLRRFLVAAMLIAAMLVAALDAALAGAATPQAVVVRPSGPEVPANLLRISIEFTAPVEGPVLGRIGLRHTDGRVIEAPFLQQELWSPDSRVLTILMHPGRVKTGLNAREQLGPILVAGEKVVLTLDGQPVKQWNVGPEDRNGPVASAWKLSPVRPDSREPLVVALDGPIDGRDADYLAVVDMENHLVDGQASLKDGERTWAFTPATPWRTAPYRLMVRGTLEDSSGNRLNGHFETSIGNPAAPASDESIPFTVGRSNRRCLARVVVPALGDLDHSDLLRPGLTFRRLVHVEEAIHQAVLQCDPTRPPALQVTY
ncbi:hypothetical protein C8J98_102123 [Luteibacter sp. OK325]|nr:hypothetical protein C8J98_102123 [Luteibacter sp. OK325]